MPGPSGRFTDDCVDGQERLQNKLSAVQAKSSPRKPSIAGANELHSVRECLAAREGEAAMLRDQVSFHSLH